MIRNPLTGKMIKASGKTAKQLLDNNAVILPKSIKCAIKSARKQTNQVGGTDESCNTVSVETITNALLNASIIPINRTNESGSISIIEAILQLPGDLVRTIGTLANDESFNDSVQDINSFNLLLITDMIKTINYYKDLKKDFSKIVGFLEKQTISLVECNTNTGLKYLINVDFFDETMKSFWEKEDEMLSVEDLDTYKKANTEYVNDWENAWIIAALKSHDDQNVYNRRFIKTMNKLLTRFKRDTYTDSANTLGELITFYKSVKLKDKILIGI